ncbi:hypothetical protein IFM89_020287 [Coptis chinensis]|uniref:COP1-interacting protein 7 n=1 Tax=Coptis chinensis TaxID=261450 RepID=A0A835I1W9_9MAGN|nr:hypothetical protein IFM89_020287 [Coptis chinensis]
MKSKTRLDSAVFQLTPTRTRCDLFIVANGVREKIASGLLNPFLAHLKTAQDQIAKGGYSITLEPRVDSDTTWFTKGTMERFVRFVSTPEVLERVNTIESEILQIEESIAMQSNENMGLNTQVEAHQNKVEDHQVGYLESTEGVKPTHDSDTEKAIVLYQPGAYPPEANGSTTQERNSKVQLLKVLETRKVVLQKEQGMAFARAVAAGFEMDHIVHLISFGECFGATRLMDACIKFVQLWKEKHETGQWLEIDSAETMSGPSDVSSMIAPGTVISIEAKKQNESGELWHESNVDLSKEGSGKASHDTGAEKRPPLDTQIPPGSQEYFQGQYQHPMYPQWPIHPHGAPPIFQPYPMHAMPYYQNYPGNGPFFQPPYPPMDDPRFNPTQRVGQRRQSMESKDSNTESESGEPGVPRMRPQDVSELENEGSQGREPRRKGGRASKKQAGMVVIRNINYITSKKNNSGSESESASDRETDDEFQDEMKLRNSKTSEIGAKDTSSTNIYSPSGKDDGVYGEEADGESWQAFQKFLLRNDDKDVHNTDQNMFSMDKEAQVKQPKNKTGPDPIIPRGQELSELHDGRMIDLDINSHKATRLFATSSEELVASGRDFSGEFSNSRANVHEKELEGGRGGHRRLTKDDFMIHRRENQFGLMNSQSDPLDGNELGHSSDNWDMRPPHAVIDESFVVPFRSGLQDQSRTGNRTPIDMDAEFPSGQLDTEDPSSRVQSHISSYEPEDMSLIRARGTEWESIGYDPAIDYDMQAQADDVGSVQNRTQDDTVRDVKKGQKELVKDKKSKGQDSLEKRKIEAATRKGKPSKLGPSTEAQARAANLRAFKADLQKMKKENEEEELKRLEALKRERQKRIAGRGNSSPAQSQHPSQMKPRLPTKLSPNSHKASKFSDSGPGSSSPIQKLPIRTASMGSNESEKVSKPSRLSNSGRLAVNKLSRSVSSLPELKKDKDVTTPEPKVPTARTRRLSEPKTSTNRHDAPVKLRSPNPVSKSKVSDEPEIKKISAIMSLDRTKAATLPELKLRTPKGTSDIIENKSAAKDTQKANGTRSLVTPNSTEVVVNKEYTSHDRIGEDNPIIEKGAKPDLVPEYAAIHAPVSPQLTGEVVAAQNPSECQFNGESSSHKVKKGREGKETPNISSIGISGKPYQAPYAWVSSVEDRCATQLEYANAPKKEIAATNEETTNAQVSDFGDLNSLEESPDSSEKPRGKDPSKGFKRLLKFGRKNNGSSAGEHSVDSDKLTTNGSHGDDHSASSTPYEGIYVSTLAHQGD